MYTKSFKALMVRKMADPNGPGATSIAKEIGVSQSTLYRWASGTDTVDVAELPEPPSFSMSMKRMSNMKRPQDWSPEEKLAAVLEAASLSEEDLGPFLRSRGLHEAHLQQWHDQMLVGLEPAPTTRTVRKRIQGLEKELLRKDRALAETAALLVLKKKAQDIWGDEDDDTTL
jgi:transposase-like protein